MAIKVREFDGVTFTYVAWGPPPPWVEIDNKRHGELSPHGHWDAGALAHPIYFYRVPYKGGCYMTNGEHCDSFEKAAKLAIKAKREDVSEARNLVLNYDIAVRMQAKSNCPKDTT